MGIYTKKSFETLLGLSKGYVNTYVSRKKLVLNENGDIDDAHPINKEFKEKQLAKKILKETTEISEAINGSQTKNNGSDNEKLQNKEQSAVSADMMYHTRMERRKDELALQKSEDDAKISRLKYQQLEGKVIPTDLVISIFKRTNISIMTAFHQASEEIAADVSQRLGGKREDLIYIKSKLIAVTNEAIEKTMDSTTSEIASIVSEYSVMRDQGEKKL